VTCLLWTATAENPAVCRLGIHFVRTVQGCEASAGILFPGEYVRNPPRPASVPALRGVPRKNVSPSDMLGRTGNKCTSGKALSVRSACNSALPAILWKNFPRQKFQASYAAGDHLEECSPSEIPSIVRCRRSSGRTFPAGSLTVRLQVPLLVERSPSVYLATQRCRPIIWKNFLRQICSQHRFASHRDSDCARRTGRLARSDGAIHLGFDTLHCRAGSASFGRRFGAAN
jgi:hypothetical protein